MDTDLKLLNEVYSAYIQHGKNINKAAKALKMNKAKFGTLLDKAKEAFNDNAREPKILFFDGEFSEILSGNYGLYEQSTSHSRVLQEWFFISAQWAWNDGRVETISVCDNPDEYNKHFATPLKDLEKYPKFDRHIVKKVHEIFSEADFIVYHNGNAFDMKKFNSRAVMLGLPPIPEIKTFDTLKVARSKFKFTSNKLGDLCEILDLKYRKKTPFHNDFFKAATGDLAAAKRVVEYGKGDIPTLREIYYKLRPYAKTHPNMNLFKGTDACCPTCGGQDLKDDGSAARADTRVKRYRCGDCGKRSNSNTVTLKAKVK